MGLAYMLLGMAHEVGPLLVDRVDYIMFTGSTRTGKIVAKPAVDRLIGCSLELGGKNPMVVLADADLERTVAGLEQRFETLSREPVLQIDAVTDGLLAMIRSNQQEDLFSLRPQSLHRPHHFEHTPLGLTQRFVMRRRAEGISVQGEIRVRQPQHGDGRAAITKDLAAEPLRQD